MKYALISALGTAIALLVFFSAILPTDSHAQGLTGAWEGEATQDDPPLTYKLEINLNGNRGTYNYPSLRCGGTLEFIKADGTTFWYQEHLTYGKDKCIDGGIIQMRQYPLGDNTIWAWQWEGEGITIRGLLREAV